MVPKLSDPDLQVQPSFTHSSLTLIILTVLIPTRGRTMPMRSRWISRNVKPFVLKEKSAPSGATFKTPTWGHSTTASNGRANATDVPCKNNVPVPKTGAES